MSPRVMMIVIVGGLAAVALIVLGIYNRLVRLRMQVREAWSGIDVQLRRRASLIPNLVETVKGYAAHERAVFEQVTRARSALQQAGSARQAANANQQLTASLGRLFAVAENYPHLRASENFVRLQEELVDIEDKIAFARQFYNRNVLAYNTSIQSIPAVVIADKLGFRSAEFFETTESVRSEVPCDFTPAVTPSTTA